MKPEIEKKFLIKSEPPGFDQLPRKILRQGYLMTTRSRQIRVRSISEQGQADRYFFAAKDEGPEGRMETEFELLPAQFEALWPLTEGRRVEKERRYLHDPARGTFEIDLYLGGHGGLRVVEIEFPSREAAASFQPPDWLGEEVTGRPEYSNTLLACSRCPTDP